MSRPVLSNLGLVLQIAGMLMVLPIILGFHFQEIDALISYFLTTITFFIAGFLFNAFSKREDMDLKSSAILITSVFFLLGLVGSIPYLYLDTFPGSPLEKFVNSYFESLSGYTTAGFTMVENVDALPESLVFYRSLTQWIGGIGIVFILLAFFYPEGRSIRSIGRVLGLDRIIAGIKLMLSHVLLVYTIYAALFVWLLYLIGFTDLVQSVAVILSALATGGLSPVSDFAFLTSGPLFIFIIAAMFLGSLNFFVHDKIVRAKVHGIFRNEFLAFVVIIIVGILAFFFASGLTFENSVLHAMAASTTVGFSSSDINGLNDISKIILMGLMFVGGMTFSTSGGIKVLRLIIFLKVVPWAIGTLMNGSKSHITYEGERIDQNNIHTFMLLPGLVMMLIFVSLVVFVLHGFTISEGLFETISSYSLTGFSTGAINIDTPATLKAWLMLVFVVGRVEVIAFLIVFMRRRPHVHEGHLH